MSIEKIDSRSILMLIFFIADKICIAKTLSQFERTMLVFST